MHELAVILTSEPTSRIFIAASAAFILAYAAGFVFLRGWSENADRRGLVQRHLASGLGAALISGGVGFGMHSAMIGKIAPAGPSAATISPEEIQGHMNTKALPIVRVQEPF